MGLQVVSVVPLVVLVYLVALVAGLDNGVALTPPMGWLSWERYRCNIDCEQQPHQCISENLYVAMADRLVDDGYLAAGYQYVNLDDCVMELERQNGTLVANKERFPRGIKWLADYVHSRGLKLGIYTDIGDKTCGGYPGSEGHFETDAATFASWGIDSVKVDGCHKGAAYDIAYPALGRALNATGRPMVYYCSWPAYIIGKANFGEIAKYCNGWRSYNDIADSSSSLFGIIEFWKADAREMAASAGPGAWNDADMLIIGDFGLSKTLAQVQMSIWSIIASPMLMSNDLREISDEAKQVLQNRKAIAVSQDKLGRQGTFKVSTETGSVSQVDWWVRPLSNGDFAVAAFCQSQVEGTWFTSNVTLGQLGITWTDAVVDPIFSPLPKLPHQSHIKHTLALVLAPQSVAFVRISNKSPSIKI